MMLIRINALYVEQKWIARSLGALLFLETGVNIWLISGAERVGFPFLKFEDLLMLLATQRYHIVPIQASMV
jgi:hypothetical protein